MTAQPAPRLPGQGPSGQRPAGPRQTHGPAEPARRPRPGASPWGRRRHPGYTAPSPACAEFPGRSCRTGGEPPGPGTAVAGGLRGRLGPKPPEGRSPAAEVSGQAVLHRPSATPCRRRPELSSDAKTLLSPSRRGGKALGSQGALRRASVWCAQRDRLAGRCQQAARLQGFTPGPARSPPGPAEFLPGPAHLATAATPAQAWAPRPSQPLGFAPRARPGGVPRPGVRAPGGAGAGGVSSRHTAQAPGAPGSGGSAQQRGGPGSGRALAPAAQGPARRRDALRAESEPRATLGAAVTPGPGEPDT